jgi:hypothetical protein
MATDKRAAVVSAVTGARGVGKTQLAREYARWCISQEWSPVAWIRADDPEVLRAS